MSPPTNLALILPLYIKVVVKSLCVFSRIPSVLTCYIARCLFFVFLNDVAQYLFFEASLCSQLTSRALLPHSEDCRERQRFPQTPAGKRS